MSFVMMNIESYHYERFMKENGGNIMAIVRYTAEEMKRLKDETDWERVRNMSDDDIDFSDIPELTDEMVARMVKYSYGKPIDKDNKVEVDLKIDNDVYIFFKSMGNDWQARINETLLQAVKFKKIFVQ